MVHCGSTHDVLLLQGRSNFTFLQFLMCKGLVRIFSSPEPKAHKASLYDGSRAGVRPCICSDFQT